MGFYSKFTSLGAPLDPKGCGSLLNQVCLKDSGVLDQKIDVIIWAKQDNIPPPIFDVPAIFMCQ